MKQLRNGNCINNTEMNLLGYEDVPSYKWFINELKTNEKFRNKYGKVTLEFDSFEEAQDIQNALNGWKYKHFIYMFDQKLRSIHKYGAALQGNGQATEEEMDVCYRLRDVLREMLQEDNLTIED